MAVNDFGRRVLGGQHCDWLRFNAVGERRNCVDEMEFLLKLLDAEDRMLSPAAEELSEDQDPSVQHMHIILGGHPTLSIFSPAAEERSEDRGRDYIAAHETHVLHEGEESWRVRLGPKNMDGAKALGVTPDDMPVPDDLLHLVGWANAVPPVEEIFFENSAKSYTFTVRASDLVFVPAGAATSFSVPVPSLATAIPFLDSSMWRRGFLQGAGLNPLSQLSARFVSKVEELEQARQGKPIWTRDVHWLDWDRGLGSRDENLKVPGPLRRKVKDEFQLERRISSKWKAVGTRPTGLTGADRGHPGPGREEL